MTSVPYIDSSFGAISSKDIIELDVSILFSLNTVFFVLPCVEVIENSCHRGVCEPGVLGTALLARARFGSGRVGVES